MRNRKALYREQQGLCFWCREPMTWRVLRGGACAPDDCTVDHYYSRLDIRREQYAHVQVAAHRSCNELRAWEEIKRLPAWMKVAISRGDLTSAMVRQMLAPAPAVQRTVAEEPVTGSR